jgi:hypothetical protein
MIGGRKRFIGGHMFIVEVTKTDYRTGEVKTWRDRKHYKTERGATNAAASWNVTTKPNGKDIVSETQGRVIYVSW